MKSQFLFQNNKILLYLLSGIFYILSFPKFNFYWLAWISLVPLIIAIDKEKDLKKVIRGTLLSGWVVFLGGMYWLTQVTWVGCLILTFYLSLYFVVFGVIRFYYKNFFIIPLSWTVLEFIRGFFGGGMPWLLIGSSQSCFLPLIQIANITGVYGVTFIVVLINAGIVELLRKKKTGPLFFSLIVFILVVLYGVVQLRKPVTGEKLSVGIVQPNIPQSIKWDPEYEDAMVTKLKILTRKVVPCDLVVWPETAVPSLGEDRQMREEVCSFVKTTNSNFIVGSPGVAYYNHQKEYYNSAFLISQAGTIIGEYQKLHLVPFGEYVPFEDVFPFVKSFTPINESFSPGDEYALFNLNNINLATLICFEDIFPELTREFVSNGARLLVNITNDAWFGDTAAAYQHAALACFRAVENGVYLVRATNTGFSCFIDSKGRIYKTVKDKEGKEICIAGYAKAEMLATKADTIYTRYGNVFIWCCFFSLLTLMLAPIIIGVNNKNKEK